MEFEKSFWVKHFQKIILFYIWFFEWLQRLIFNNNILFLYIKERSKGYIGFKNQDKHPSLFYSAVSFYKIDASTLLLHH